MGFRQADYVRAVKAATAAGLKVYQTEIHPDGRIVLIHQEVDTEVPVMPTEAERAAERERRRQILRDLKAKFAEEAKQKTAEKRRARDAEKAAADAARKSRTRG